jgi:hypothetical protein
VSVVVRERSGSFSIPEESARREVSSSYSARIRELYEKLNMAASNVEGRERAKRGMGDEMGGYI